MALLTKSAHKLRSDEPTAPNDHDLHDDLHSIAATWKPCRPKPAVRLERCRPLSPEILPPQIGRNPGIDARCLRHPRHSDNNGALGMGAIRDDHMTNLVGIEEITPETWDRFVAVNFSG